MASRLDFSQIRSLYVGTIPSTTVDTNNLIVAGNVGIGTTATNALLSISKTISSDTRFLEINNAGNNQFRSDIDFTVTSGGVTVGRISSIYPSSNNVGLSFSTYGTSPSTGLHERMRINGSDGNVGIGTTSPGQKLHVSGFVRANGAQISDGTITAFIGQEKSWTGTGTSNNLVIASETGFATNFYTDGTASVKMTITAGGNVGIGTTGPQAKLHIVGRTKLQNDYFAEWRNVVNFVYDGTGVGGYVVTTPFAIDSNYDMHITHVIGYGYGGEALIDFKVVYYAYISAPANYSIVDSGNDGMVKYLGKDSNGYVTICFGGLSDSNYFYRFNVNHYATRFPGNDYSSGWSISQTTSSNYGMSALYALSPAITQRTSGNVGIGTTSPTLGLHVADGKGLLVGPSSSSGSMYVSPQDENTINGSYGIAADTADIWLNYRGYQDGFSYFRDTRIGNGKGTAILMVDGSEGHVGIGTTAPLQKLHVVGAVVGGNTATTGLPNTSGVTTQLAFEARSTQFGNDPSIAYHKEAVYTMYLQGQNSPRGLRLYSPTGETTANFYVQGDVVAFSSSDRRLKDNLSPIPNALDKVSKLTGYEFDWNENQSAHSGHDYGVVAQEVEAVLPELVQTREDGYKAVKYDKIVAVLIEAIKEQQKQIDELKSKLK